MRIMVEGGAENRRLLGQIQVVHGDLGDHSIINPIKLHCYAVLIVISLDNIRNSPATFTKKRAFATYPGFSLNNLDGLALHIINRICDNLTHDGFYCLI